MTDEMCFIDCETTGLNPLIHVPWEIALRIDEEPYVWTIELDADEGGRADSTALRLTNYYERITEARKREWVTGRNKGYVLLRHRHEFAWHLVRIIGQRHLAGNVVGFDDRFVGDFLRRAGYAPAWHYHLIDVESLVAGHLKIAPPWKSTDLSKALGIDPELYDRHTALEDARWAQDVYEAVMA